MDATFTQARHIHFTGIKGVGMTAAALCALDLGISVSGSDVEEDFVTQGVLKQKNITPKIGFSSENIPDNTDLLVYTGAHQGQDNPEVKAASEKGIPTISHAQAVGQLMQNKFGVSVCGVGGKTTTAAMITNVLDYANLKPSFLIGVGKVLNLQVPGRYAKDGKHFIAEADEYVVSPGADSTPRFMFQQPQVAVCTNVVHDHPDQYADINATKKAFNDFFQKLTDQDTLIINGDSPALMEIIPDIQKPNIIKFGQQEHNDWRITDSFVGQDKQLISITHDGEEFNLTLPVPGMYNARNALAAFLACQALGLERQQILEGLQLFRGSMRRFEKKGEVDNILFYDDYAHHPSQVEAMLKAAQPWLPLHRIVAVFQPHTYSRTKALFDDFVQSFSHADHVIITDIYASARESADDSVSGFSLAEAIKQHHQHVEYIPYQDLVNHLKSTLKPGDALLTLGAGDIYHIHDQIIRQLSNTTPDTNDKSQ